MKGQYADWSVRYSEPARIPGLFRAWILSVTVGECIGFCIPAFVGALVMGQAAPVAFCCASSGRIPGGCRPRVVASTSAAPADPKAVIKTLDSEHLGRRRAGMVDRHAAEHGARPLVAMADPVDRRRRSRPGPGAVVFDRDGAVVGAQAARSTRRPLGDRYRGGMVRGPGGILGGHVTAVAAGPAARARSRNWRARELGDGPDSGRRHGMGVDPPAPHRSGRLDRGGCHHGRSTVEVRPAMEERLVTDPHPRTDRCADGCGATPSSRSCACVHGVMADVVAGAPGSRRCRPDHPWWLRTALAHGSSRATRFVCPRRGRCRSSDGGFRSATTYTRSVSRPAVRAGRRRPCAIRLRDRPIATPRARAWLLATLVFVAVLGGGLEEPMARLRAARLQQRYTPAWRPCSSSRGECGTYRCTVRWGSSSRWSWRSLPCCTTAPAVCCCASCCTPASRAQDHLVLLPDAVVEAEA